MTCIEYKINSNRYNYCGGEYISYGITAIDCNTKNELKKIEDISISEKEITELIEKCNELGLEVMHLSEVVDDFLAV